MNYRPPCSGYLLPDEGAEKQCDHQENKEEVEDHPCNISCTFRYPGETKYPSDQSNDKKYEYPTEHSG